MVSLRTLLTWLAISVPAIVSAEPPRPTLVFPSEVFPLLAGDEEQRQEAVSRFLANDAKLQSWDRDQSFQFEIVSHMPTNDGLEMVNRFLVDCRNGKPRLFSFPDNIILGGVNTAEGRLQLRMDGKWRAMPHARWGIFLNRDHGFNFLDAVSIPYGESAAIEFFPTGYVQKYPVDEALGPAWMPKIQAFGFDRPGKSRIRVQLRGPNDTLRYGSELGRIEQTAIATSIANGKEHPAFMEVKSVQIGETFTCMQDISYADLVQKHATNLPEPDMKTPVNRHVIIPGSMAVWETLAGTPKVAVPTEMLEPLRQQTNPRGESTGLSAASFAAWTLAQLAPELTEDDRPPLGEGRLVELRKMLQSAVVHAESEVLAEIGDSSWVDDMPMRWRHFEKRIGPSQQHGFSNSAIKLYHQKNNTESERFYLLTLMGRLGLPSGIGNHYLAIDSTVSDLLHRDVLLSLWQLEPAEGGHERMVTRLAEARDEPEVRYALVTALLATGRIDDVRQEDLLEWIDRAIFSGDQRQQVIGTFHITRHPSGSRFLLDQKDAWLDGKDDPTGCLAALKSRAEATLELERFDFLTREQCQEILELWRQYAM